MYLHVACARRRLGEILAGDEGSTLVAAGTRWMDEQGIRNPDAMTRTIVPWCAGP